MRPHITRQSLVRPPVPHTPRSRRRPAKGWRRSPIPPFLYRRIPRRRESLELGGVSGGPLIHLYISFSHELMTAGGSGLARAPLAYSGPERLRWHGGGCCSNSDPAAENTPSRHVWAAWSRRRAVSLGVCLFGGDPGHVLDFHDGLSSGLSFARYLHHDWFMGVNSNQAFLSQCIFLSLPMLIRERGGWKDGERPCDVWVS